MARLIQQFRKSAGLSVHITASMAENSEGRWRQAAKGYHRATKDVRVLVNAPAETLARMACSVGLRSGPLCADYIYDDGPGALSQEDA